jgi:hypothetical protein
MIHIIGGGTVTLVRPHLQLCAYASGRTAITLAEVCELYDRERNEKHDDIKLHLTRMAGGDRKLHTVNDVGFLIDRLVEDRKTKMIFMPVAMCNYRGSIYLPEMVIRIEEQEKMIRRIRKERKDIYLVGFKQTHGMTEDDQYLAGLSLLKAASCNLVLANDDISRMNMIIVPEEARYSVTENRLDALKELVKIAMIRSQGTFTRSEVFGGSESIIKWDHPLIPDTFRKIINHVIERGAYKPFGPRRATAGHFAVKIGENEFFTSIRGSNFNEMKGLVRVRTDLGDHEFGQHDRVVAYGARPSVGGRSQVIVFNKNREYDCIVHFHCEKKAGSLVPVASQREFECGSHECGRNTADHLMKMGNLSCVYLDNHGPNIVFHRSINPQEVIDFIEANFDLSRKTGGSVNQTRRGQERQG